MNEINEKLDKIILILNDIANDIREAKSDTTKMSQHIDTVDYYVQIFDAKFRQKNKISSNINAIENSLD
tara:strand:- start:2130 stop:2336 length:207 start_codon:yes stop_codon:yes gene_type:complete